MDRKNGIRKENPETIPISTFPNNQEQRLKNYKGTEFLSMSRDVDKFYRCLSMSRDVDKFYRCLSMSRDVDRRQIHFGGRWAKTRATTTTTSIDFIDVSRCLATSIDVYTFRRQMGANQGDDDDDDVDVDRFYRCLSMSRDVDKFLSMSLDVSRRR